MEGGGVVEAGRKEEESHQRVLMTRWWWWRPAFAGGTRENEPTSQNDSFVVIAEAGESCC